MVAATLPSLTLISHACVIIDTGETRILTDPWLFGTAFNNSWALIAPAADLAPYLDTIDYLWISHEHPDHFHIPSLKSLPESFKQRVTVLFQQSSDHPKMVSALNKLGFSTVRLLPHRTWVQCGAAEVFCYQSRHLDSALAVRTPRGTVLKSRPSRFTFSCRTSSGCKRSACRAVTGCARTGETGLRIVHCLPCPTPGSACRFGAR